MEFPLVKPLNTGLPQNGLWDTVYPHGQVTRRNWAFRLVCRHARQTAYTRTDYRDGPGGYSDSYAGLCCQTCGKVLEERRTF